MDEALVDPEACPVVRRHRYIDTSFITPIRLQDHSAVAALFPPTIPSPNDLAPPLTAEVKEEWRWLVHPPSRSAEEQRVAECELQPTLTECYQDRTGRLRYRPAVVVPEGRTPNDFDQLLDTRAYSPNNRIRGTWDFDPDEIARENSFTPPHVEPAPGIASEPARVHSPLHEDGSLAQMMAGSLAEPTPPPPDPPTFASATFFSTSGIGQHEMSDFADGLRALPQALQSAVVVLQRFNNMSWMDELHLVEEFDLQYNLMPERRAIYVKTLNLYQGFKDNIEALDKEGQGLKARFRGYLELSWRLVNDDDPADQPRMFFETLFSDDLEHGTLRNGNVIDGLKFWYHAVKLIDNYDLPVIIRQTAVLRLLNIKRIQGFQEIAPYLKRWIDSVGNEEREARGIYREGDFWTWAEDWEKALETLEDSEKFKMSPEDAEIVTRENLERTITFGQYSLEAEDQSEAEDGGGDGEDTVVW